MNEGGKFHVVKTSCWPNIWKVESLKWPGRDNAACNFFKNREDAICECNRRNKLWEARI